MRLAPNPVGLSPGSRSFSNHLSTQMPEILERENRLFQLSNSLAAELTEEHAGREIVVAALIEQIVVHLLRHHSNMRRSDELELSRVGLVDRRIRRSIELMQAQLDQDLSLREIAAASCLSPFHFARLFKKLTGTTPHSYLASLRTTRAQLMLAETDYSHAAGLQKQPCSIMLDMVRTSAMQRY